MRVAVLGLALALAGCVQPPPVIHVTIVNPAPATKAPEPNPVFNEANQVWLASERQREAVTAAAVADTSPPDPNAPGIWPAWGWRVTGCPRAFNFDQCQPHGPPLKHQEQCQTLAKLI